MSIRHTFDRLEKRDYHSGFFVVTQQHFPDHPLGCMIAHTQGAVSNGVIALHIAYVPVSFSIGRSRTSSKAVISTNLLLIIAIFLDPMLFCDGEKNKKNLLCVSTHDCDVLLTILGDKKKESWRPWCLLSSLLWSSLSSMFPLSRPLPSHVLVFHS